MFLLNIREIFPMIRGAEPAILFGCERSSRKQSESITHHIREAMHLPCPHTVVWATPPAWNPIPCLLITYSSRVPLWEASPRLQLSVFSICPWAPVVLPVTSLSWEFIPVHNLYVSSSGQRWTNFPLYFQSLKVREKSPDHNAARSTAEVGIEPGVLMVYPELLS